MAGDGVEVPKLDEWEDDVDVFDDDFDADLCNLCELNPKAKNQCQCSACLAEVKAADKDAKKEGPQAHKEFRQCRKTGGTLSNLLLMFHNVQRICCNARRYSFQKHHGNVQREVWSSWPRLQAAGFRLGAAFLHCAGIFAVSKRSSNGVADEA